MATVNTRQMAYQAGISGPYGNGWKKKFTYQTTAAGVAVNTDKATAVAANDIVRLGIVPAGVELHDALAIVSDAFTATTTAKIGFAYVDGVDDAAVPQDDDYFFAALNTAATGRTRANNAAVRPVRLPKDAYLILTRTTAADASVGVLDLIVEGENLGPA